MKSVFVQISSYHDYELEKTIRNAIEKSSGQTQLFFGVHSIFCDNNEWIKSVKEIPNVKIIESKAPENIGVGLGRSIAHSLYNGEDYYFQIDAHSRFDNNWDIFLINEINVHKNNGFKKPIITNYPKPYWYEDGKEKTRDHEELPTQFAWRDKDGFRLYRQPSQVDIPNPEGNVFSNSISAGSLFTEGEFLKPNSLILFSGEELLAAASAYTNGYDLFIPSKTFMYHLYSNYKSEGINRRKFIPEDWPDENIKLEEISKKELSLVLTGDGITGEGRLGTQRTLSDYGRFAGLDFHTGEVLKNLHGVS